MKLRITTISILVVGLLAGSAVVVVAQGDGSASEASYFTWDTAGPPEFSEDPVTGLPAVTVAIEATDQRAAGTATNIEDGGQVEDDDWSYNVKISSVRLVNDGGSWVGTSRGVNAFDQSEASDGGRAWLSEYTGEGGYQGLTMYTFRLGTGDQPPASVGFIVPSDVIPPFPALPAE